jgi:hypothetical protein
VQRNSAPFPAVPPLAGHQFSSIPSLAPDRSNQTLAVRHLEGVAGKKQSNLKSNWDTNQYQQAIDPYIRSLE